MPDLSTGHIFLIVFGFIGLLCVFYLMKDQRRSAALRAAARELGLEFRGTDRSFYATHLASGGPFSEGEHPLVRNLMVGTVGGVPVRVFDLRAIARSVIDQTVLGIHGLRAADDGGGDGLSSRHVGDWEYVFLPGVLLSADHVVQFVRQLTGIAGDAGAAGAAGEEDWVDEVLEPSRPRLLHYLFAHRALWAGVFDEPGFVEALFGDDGDEAVGHLWKSLASEVEADPLGAAAKWRMPPAEARRLPTGLDAAGEAPQVASVGAHAAGRYAVVRLSRPVSSPEAAFAAVLLAGDDAAEARYFVWELTRSRARGAGDAILCEWLPDGSRRNHGRTGSAGSESAFVGALTGQLDGEAERVRAGAPAIAAPTRRPGEAVDPVDFMLSAAEQASFRQQHCIMAFDVLPKAVAREPRRWAAAIESASLAPLLEALWREAGEAAAKFGHRGDVPSQGLAGSAARIAGRPCALITFPKPFSPPEPYYAVVFPEGLGTVGGGGGAAPVVYTLEMTDAFGELPPVVAWIDSGSVHAIAGECGGTTLAEFEKALGAVAAGRRLPDSGTTIRQLLLYAQVGPPPKPAAESLSG